MSRKLLVLSCLVLFGIALTALDFFQPPAHDTAVQKNDEPNSHSAQNELETRREPPAAIYPEQESSSLESSIVQVDLPPPLPVDASIGLLDSDCTMLPGAATIPRTPDCPSSNKWNKLSDQLVESFAPDRYITRHAVDSPNDVSPVSFS